MELKNIEEFLGDVGFLTLGRDFVFGTSVCFSLGNVITSLELTLESVIACCESACIADARACSHKQDCVITKEWNYKKRNMNKSKNAFPNNGSRQKSVTWTC